MTRCLCIYLAIGGPLLGACAPEAQPPTLNHPNYQATVEGCPATLVLTVPSEFQPAQTAAALATKARILDTLHANPARRARYSEVFLMDWDDPKGFPQLTVASLGSLIAHQGNISQEEWASIKSEFTSSTAEQRARILDQYLARSSSGASFPVLKAQIDRLYPDTDDSFIIVGFGTGTVHSDEVAFLSAARVTYTQQCVAYTTIAVDADSPNALLELNRLMSQMSVK